MSVNILEKVQQHLNYQPLQKIDPNTQEVVVDNNTPNEDRFSQAAIPAAIIAFYKFSTTENGAATILQMEASSDWLTTIFGKKKDAFINSICSYANQPFQNCLNNIYAIFSATLRAIKEQLPAKEDDIEALKTLLADQRSLVLPYLPAEIQLGELMEDSTLDDRTNKMEGPVSNLMHAIGNIFSSSDQEKVQN
jgi:hypothetical protein